MATSGFGNSHPDRFSLLSIYYCLGLALMRALRFDDAASSPWVKESFWSTTARSTARSWKGSLGTATWAYFHRCRSSIASHAMSYGHYDPMMLRALRREWSALGRPRRDLLLHGGNAFWEQPPGHILIAIYLVSRISSHRTLSCQSHRRPDSMSHP